jgi:DNA primase large subunit
MAFGFEKFFGKVKKEEPLSEKDRSALEIRNYLDSLVPAGVSAEDFWEAVKLMDMRKSGNPKDISKRHNIEQNYAELIKGGEYKPYVDDVIESTIKNLPELLKEIKAGRGATFTN